jgi:glutaredoxin-like YruB-family protein
MLPIKIYSTPTCTYCQIAKQFFAENDLSYEDINVAEDNSKLQEMVEISGQMGVPVIKIGENIVVGFDESKVKELLSI